MDKTYRFTVDIDGYDFGGRSKSLCRTIDGTHLILQQFKKYHIKGLFFISTELLSTGYDENYGDALVKDILTDEHAIGSHGHFHIKYKGINRISREINDKNISQKMLSKYVPGGWAPYRSPWFRLRNHGVYSNPKNHISLLKYSWFGGKITDNTIFYIHPSDIIRDESRFSEYPNLFCRILYSKPERVYEAFIDILDRYSGRSYLE